MLWGHVDWILYLGKHNGTEVSVQPKRFWNAKGHCVQANWYCYFMLNSFFINCPAFYCAYFNPLLIQCLANTNSSSCCISTILDVSHQRVFSLCYIKSFQNRRIFYIPFHFLKKPFSVAFFLLLFIPCRSIFSKVHTSPLANAKFWQVHILQ